MSFLYTPGWIYKEEVMQILNNHPELDVLGLRNLEKIYWQLHTSQLVEEAILRHEGMVAHMGPLAVRTGNLTHHTARDSFIVREPSTQHDIAWGENHRRFSPESFDRLYNKMMAYLQGTTIFVQNCFVGADKNIRMPFRIITQTAWHSLFARNMFFTPTDEEMDAFVPAYTLIHVPEFRAVPDEDDTNSDIFVVVNFQKRIILIGGTSYAGEIKKAVFSVMNYLPRIRDSCRCGPPPTKARMSAPRFSWDVRAQARPHWPLTPPVS
jgi:phosphoenolpyruvate carboxykinase (ATP)